MGTSLWDQVGLPLLIGLAIQIVATALCFLSVRLWNCFIRQLPPQTAVEESANDQPPSDGDAAAYANAMPDLEIGNGYGPAEGGESMAEPELEMGIVNGGEGLMYEIAGMEHFCNQEALTPDLIKSPVSTPKAQVTRVAARGALVPVEMGVPHSQQEEEVAE